MEKVKCSNGSKSCLLHRNSPVLPLDAEKLQEGIHVGRVYHPRIPTTHGKTILALCSCSGLPLKVDMSAAFVWLQLTAREVEWRTNPDFAI
jgi:hypothetical protein